MTESELIARQAKSIEELRDQIADLKRRVREARMLIYCIGGPLNDNDLEYTKAQMQVFFKISDCLGEDDE